MATPQERLATLRAEWEARQQALQEAQGRVVQLQQAMKERADRIHALQTRKAQLEAQIRDLGG